MTDERDLRRLYAGEPDSVLEKALSRGPDTYTSQAWLILTQEAARRCLSSPGTDPLLEEDDPAPPPLIHSVGLMPGRLAVWVAVVAWMTQVIRFARIVEMHLPVWLLSKSLHPKDILYSLVTQNFLGLVALASGFQATRSPYAQLGKLLMVVSLGLVFAESSYYLLGALGAR